MFSVIKIYKFYSANSSNAYIMSIIQAVLSTNSKWMA